MVWSTTARSSPVLGRQRGQLGPDRGPSWQIWVTREKIGKAGGLLSISASTIISAPIDRMGEDMAQHRRGARVAGILLVLAATWVWAAPAPGQPGTAASDEAAAGAVAQVATETTPLVATSTATAARTSSGTGRGPRPTTCGSAGPTGTSPGCR
jgi:hypothetical protein